jgi:hypothetical protein
VRVVHEDVLIDPAADELVSRTHRAVSRANYRASGEGQILEYATATLRMLYGRGEACGLHRWAGWLRLAGAADGDGEPPAPLAYCLCAWETVRGRRHARVLGAVGDADEVRAACRQAGPAITLVYPLLAAESACPELIGSPTACAILTACLQQPLEAEHRHALADWCLDAGLDAEATRWRAAALLIPRVLRGESEYSGGALNVGPT